MKMIRKNKKYRDTNIQLRPILFLGLIIIFITIFLLISWRVAYPYLQGPTIASYEYTQSGDIYHLYGTTTRTKILKVQGREVPIDAGGAFSTDIAKLYPYTILIIEAHDRFDHRLLIKKEL